MTHLTILAAELRDQDTDALRRTAAERPVSANNTLLIEAARAALAQRAPTVLVPTSSPA